MSGDLVKVEGATGCRTDRLDNFVERLRLDTRVDRHDDERVPALLVTAHLHACDVDAVLSEDAAELADYTRTIVVAEERDVCGGLQVDVVAVDLHQFLDMLWSGKRAAHRHLSAIGKTSSHGQQVPMVRAPGVGLQCDLDAPLFGQQGGIDVRDLLIGDRGKDSLESRKLEHLDI